MQQLFDAEKQFFSGEGSRQAVAENALRYFLPLYQKRQKFKPDMKRCVCDMTGFVAMQMGDYKKAAEYFTESGNLYQAGLAHLLMDNVDATFKIWTNLLEYHPFHWCISLWGMVHYQLDGYPSFFQIRNHLEGTVGQLIRYGRLDMAERIMSYADMMAQVNLETYKYIGRALYNMGQSLELAESFMLKNQRILPNDPEVYYHLAQIKADQGQLQESDLLITQCLSINASYTPASALRQKLKSSPA